MSNLRKKLDKYGIVSTFKETESTLNIVILEFPNNAVKSYECGKMITDEFIDSVIVKFTHDEDHIFLLELKK